jgi:hypothetical protein
MVYRVASVDKESERRLCLLALVAESWQARQGTRDDGGGFTASKDASYWFFYDLL